MDAWGKSEETRSRDIRGPAPHRAEAYAFFEAAGCDVRVFFAAKTAEHHETLRIEHDPMVRRFLILNRITHSAFPGAVAHERAPYGTGR